MAKYNLMDTEKPEYFDRYFDEEDDKKETANIETEKKEEQTLPDIDEREYFDESLFTEEASPEPSTPDAIADIPVDKPQEQKIAEDSSIPEQVGQIEETPAPPPPSPSPKPDTSDYDYEDSKIQGINWKPLLIWTTAFIAIVAIVFFAYTSFFSNSGEEKVIAEQKPTVSPQDQMKINQEKKKIAFIKNIVSGKKARLNNFSSLSNLKTSGVTYSSILLYDNSFNFEIFGQTRDEIAKYNQNLKKNNLDDNFKILSVDTRPGSNGGVFALYNVTESSGGGASSQVDPKIDGNIQNTVQNLIGSNSLKLIADRTITRKKVDQFEMTRKEIKCSGTEANCINLLNDLNSSNSNFNIHKISLIPTNQKNIKNSKYNLLIIVDFYV
jgi:hypothetical protein